MSYELINGRRYYKDDRSGRITLDNVSQEEAEQRVLSNQGTRRTSGTNHSSAATVRSIAFAGGLWKAIIVCTVGVLFIGAIFYNHFHFSSEEKEIATYMDVQQADDADNTGEAVNAANVSEAEDQKEDADVVEVVVEMADSYEEGTVTASYLMPDSAERCLEASEINNLSHDEIQLIINEIYARHGREFYSQENIDYFSAQDWYEPVPGKSDEEIVSEFNEFERANVDLLCQYL